MSTIKYLNRINDIPLGSINKMEAAAAAHKRFGNITFKVKENNETKVIFQVVQGKSSAGAYHSQKRLIEIAHETFGRFLPDKEILVHAICFNQSPVNEVNTGWINKQMLQGGIRIKDISIDTGIDTTQLKELVNGNAPLSQPLKAMFYYYFLSR